MDRYRVLITGSRDWRIDDLAESIVTRLLARHGPALLIVHGDCPTGADASFAEACQTIGVDQERHPAVWSQGRRAGPIRNEEMVRAGAALCLAFSRDIGRSRGTQGCARLAIAAGIPTWLVAEDRGPGTRPVRLEEV